jgi:hypothetical protein
MAVLAACSGASGGTDSRSTAPPSTSVTVPATTTTPATLVTPATGPPTTVALIPQETPDLAATALFTAWNAGDRHAALVVAIPSAVDALFAVPPAAFSDRGCQTPISAIASCAFGIGNEAAIAQIHTVSLDGGWVVQSVSVIQNN